MQRWSVDQANAWYRQMPWLVGCNYTPRTAINQLEMWQADTFDPTLIDQELGWMAGLGMNSVRVFLHDLLWKQDAAGFVDRVDRFLDIAARHGIGAMFVLFDSVWHPFPNLGKQRDPEPGVHNSYWLQSPGVRALQDPALFNECEAYVRGIVARFAEDRRVQVWDIWNEPDGANSGSYAPRDLGARKADIVAPLLSRAFAWARSAHPTQPLTTGIWLGDWSSDDSLRMFDRLQLDLSDVISFHDYRPAAELATRIGQLRRYGRPLLCTEYMARTNGSTFQGSLPVLKREHVAAYNWGFVKGKTQTHLPWDSWSKPYVAEEPTWFHEILHPDGTPYAEEEVELIRRLTKTRDA